ncbi:flagellar biosynthetic protein FliO [Opitutus terrae]|uniref:Flagellar biosynthesis protein FliO n=1 Tax=Opitutus terrae (strain DSM 11246 / JCM 15787 / PB90-1) TaxID=452637 RepID=B1ZR33_OPITP|nr:flagellar biosynthetic protein FliO [Opitutus terrae]ACB73700.1 hypothetical protein Oter_0410 [Opitutus terrae PB90-1]
MRLLPQRSRSCWRSGFAACALALAFGASGALAAPANQDEIITPKSSAQQAASPARGSGMGALTAFAAVALAATGGWMLWRGKGTPFTGLRTAPRQLAIEETRSLGARQYLVVATYQDRKYLLGVCPGRIDLLAPLNDSTPPVDRPRS